MRKRAYIFFLLFFPNTIVAQIVEHRKLFSDVVTFRAGGNWRSTVMNFFDFQNVRNFKLDVPYPTEANIQGVGLFIGTSLYIDRFNVGLTYTPTFRHDYVHTGSNLVVGEDKNHPKQFISDHDFSIFKLIKRRKRSQILGFGYTIINLGKGFFVQNPPTYNNDYFSIQFHTWNLSWAFPIAQSFYFEPQVILIPKTLPNNNRDNLLMYNFKFYIKQGTIK
ncbi:MAG: hypothetical protein U0Y10_08860 [Spirosomataceae bacterium]